MGPVVATSSARSRRTRADVSTAVRQPQLQPGPAQAAVEGHRVSADLAGLLGNSAVWLALSVAFAVGCGLGPLRLAFRSDYIVQDDTRTFLFWMARFFDPALFPHDLMADYFSAVSPPAYTALHWLAAVVFRVDPFVLNKLLPIVLGVLMTVYAFRLTMRPLPVPAAAFAAGGALQDQPGHHRVPGRRSANGRSLPFLARPGGITGSLDTGNDATRVGGNASANLHGVS
jgi:hypothetical protein